MLKDKYNEEVEDQEDTSFDIGCEYRYVNNTARPVFSDHKNKPYVWLFRQVVAYCCMKVVQKAHAFSNKQPPVSSDSHVLLMDGRFFFF